jgi:recombination protein RecT
MSKQIALVGNWSLEDVNTMKDTLAKDTNDSQFQLFLRTAHASGLNPFLNHIYAIVYQGKMSLQIGIEGIAYLAKQKEGFLGYDAQVVYDGEEFKARRNKEGVWEIEHEPNVLGNQEATIRGAYAVAYREGFKPYTVIMKWSEVEHFQKSSIPNQQTMWKRYTADMFKKHVLKRALKGQFGIDINEDDAINSEPSIENQQPYSRVEINPQEAQAFRDSIQPKDTPVQPPKTTRSTNTPPKQETPKTEPTEAEKMKEINQRIQANFFKLGIDDEAIPDYFKQHFPQLKEGDKLSYAQKQTLVKIMESEIELRAELADDLK